ncbi:hypothetical protein BDN70DRAFT_899957 [Pholiota conissans]|uniref:Uncharacterized protein n=1 Tax=Pholiota conissans TaxID=109636 RepID=A0A9P5YNT5_9AGAR|nr:hypothetical protein BDN70DRAFT_899957 [Pholiota conissans]
MSQTGTGLRAASSRQRFLQAFSLAACSSALRRACFFFAAPRFLTELEEGMERAWAGGGRPVFFSTIFVIGLLVVVATIKFLYAVVQRKVFKVAPHSADQLIKQNVWIHLLGKLIRQLHRAKLKEAHAVQRYRSRVGPDTLHGTSVLLCRAVKSAKGINVGLSLPGFILLEFEEEPGMRDKDHILSLCRWEDLVPFATFTLRGAAATQVDDDSIPDLEGPDAASYAELTGEVDNDLDTTLVESGDIMVSTKLLKEMSIGIELTDWRLRRGATGARRADGGEGLDSESKDPGVQGGIEADVSGAENDQAGVSDGGIEDAPPAIVDAEMGSVLDGDRAPSDLNGSVTRSRRCSSRPWRLSKRSTVRPAHITRG